MDNKEADYNKNQGVIAIPCVFKVKTKRQDSNKWESYNNAVLKLSKQVEDNFLNSPIVLLSFLLVCLKNLVN